MTAHAVLPEPHTGQPVTPRCWICQDTGWAVEHVDDVQTIYRTCECHLFSSGIQVTAG